MPSRVIVLEADPDPKDLARLQAEIEAFNCAATGFDDGRRLACFVRDDAGDMLAGLSGYTWGGYCRIEFLWVTERLRRRGIGRDLVATAEREARARGCALIVLDTHDFQAPRFYEKLSFLAVGRAEGCPRGSGQTWYRKTL
ncbi:MAG TPA: GNAT family N-acetyltransferase [Candidatus Eisenbacteria bacterium]|nr:GNAT family N-acetyltransferase [Candidatus Eisenbacteria bacterium]